MSVDINASLEDKPEIVKLGIFLYFLLVLGHTFQTNSRINKKLSNTIDVLRNMNIKTCVGPLLFLSVMVY